MTNLALEVTDLQAWHDDAHVLHNVNFNAAPGEAVTLLGRRGSGRSTTLRALLGLTGKRSGSIRIHGAESIHLPASKITHLGVGYCFEDYNIIADLTCEENLLLPPSSEDTLGGGMSLAEIYELLPYLEERRDSPGTRFSRGEQQILAIARILRSGANILLLNKTSEDLSPVITRTLASMITALKEKGYAIVLVDQNEEFSAPLANRFYVMDHGHIIDHFEAAELSAKKGVLNALSA